jgi:hypothetical protein
MHYIMRALRILHPLCIQVITSFVYNCTALWCAGSGATGTGGTLSLALSVHHTYATV